MHANFCRRNRTTLPPLQKRFDYHTLVLFLQISQNKPRHILLPSFPSLSLQDQDTALEKFLTVSPLYQKPQLSTVSYLEQLLCGMPCMLMFSKRALSMLLRSFSKHILKYKPSTTLLFFFFSSSSSSSSSFLLLFSLPFLLMPHTFHLQERSPTSIGLLFLQSCLNICL